MSPNRALFRDWLAFHKAQQSPSASARYHAIVALIHTYEVAERFPDD